MCAAPTVSQGHSYRSARPLQLIELNPTDWCVSLERFFALEVDRGVARSVARRRPATILLGESLHRRPRPRLVHYAIDGEMLIRNQALPFRDAQHLSNSSIFAVKA